MNCCHYDSLIQLLNDSCNVGMNELFSPEVKNLNSMVVKQN